LRDISAAFSAEASSVAMWSCSECLVFMGETLRPARDSKVMERVKKA
jgi:hypothetical protein